MNKTLQYLTITILTLVAGHLSADQVWLEDGSLLVGTVQSIENEKLTLSTQFAGELALDIGLVQKFETDSSLHIKMTDGATITGIAAADQSGTTIGNATSPIALEKVQSAWRSGAKDPDLLASEKALEAMKRKWSVSSAVGLAGKTGNARKTDLSGSIAAVLEGKEDRLELGLKYAYATSEDSSGESYTTADELAANLNYTKFFSGKMGWYARENLERDRFENLEFRSLTALGITYKLKDASDHSIEISGGLANRYESYGFDLNDDGFDDKTGTANLPGLDFSLKHYWKLTEWAEMNNTLTYNPAFEDFGNFQIDHTSTIDFPLANSNAWKLRLALSNQYRSEVAEGAETLDTTYSLSLLLNWK